MVTIYQIDQFDRLAFIAMQWLPGQTLETKLQSATTLVDEDVRRIAAQVAAGLHAAHQRQLVHRDIKPANRPESAAQVVTMLESDRHQWPMRIAGYESVQNESKATPQPSRRGFAGRWLAVVAASLLALAGWYFSPQIIRIATNQGELVIESADKDVEVQILQDGKVVRVLDTKTKNSFNIESGDYQIKATGEGNSFEVTPESLKMKRGGKQIVRVTRQSIEPSVANRVDAKPEQTNSSPEILSAELTWFEQERRKRLAQLDAKHPHIAILDRRIKLLKQQLGNPREEAPRVEKYSVTTDPKVAFDTLNRLLRGRDTWTITQDSISREKLAMHLDEKDPQISHANRRLNAFKTVVNHLKKANGLPVIDMSNAETKLLIK